MPDSMLNLIQWEYLLFYFISLGSIALFFWKKTSSNLSLLKILFRTSYYFIGSVVIFGGAKYLGGEEGPFLLLVVGSLLLFSLMWKALMEKNLSLSALKREKDVRRENVILSNALGGEFRTQLNGVVGAANLLQVTSLSAEQMQYISMIKTCSDSLQNLVDEVLAQTQGPFKPTSEGESEKKTQMTQEIPKTGKSYSKGDFQKEFVSKGSLAETPVGMGAPQERKLKILIADDVEVNLVVMRKYLEKLGFECDSAVNGKEVVNMVNKKQYDLLLLDCQMPEMDGFAATTEILRSFPEPTARPFIIAVTAHGNEGDKQRSKTVGMDGFITKPFSIQLLKETLQNVCQIKNVVYKAKPKGSEAA